MFHRANVWAVKHYRFWIDFFATGAFVGRLRPAPGTWGTLWGIPVALLFSRWGLVTYLSLTVLFIIFSVAVAQLHEVLHSDDQHARADGNAAGAHDAQEVVIDEVAGYLVAFAALPLNSTSVVAAFVLFRAFDIVKPFPISWLDRRVRGGLGTVVDDLAAGLAANVILQVLL